MSEVRVGQVTSEVTVSDDPPAPESPSVSTPEALERDRALRARAARIAARTRAEGFDD